MILAKNALSIARSMFGRGLGFALIVVAMASTANAALHPTDTPEIDPSSIASAVTLLGAGLMLVRTRRSR